MNQYSNGYSVALLYVITVLSISLGIYTIVSKNPVVSILFLIGLFFSMSLYLIAIGLQFIGLSYLLVYVGAVSMLFLFILMLINIRVSELITDNSNSIPLALISIILFNFSINDSTPYSIYSNLLNTDNSLSANAIIVDYAVNLYGGEVLDVSESNRLSWDGLMVTTSHISSIGMILYTNLFVPFVITSLILLLAMIGAIMITASRSANVDYHNQDNSMLLSTTNPASNTLTSNLSFNFEYSPVSLIDTGPTYCELLVHISFVILGLTIIMRLYNVLCKIPYGTFTMGTITGTLGFGKPNPNNPNNQGCRHQYIIIRTNHFHPH